MSKDICYFEETGLASLKALAQRFLVPGSLQTECMDLPYFCEKYFCVLLWEVHVLLYTIFTLVQVSIISHLDHWNSFLTGHLTSTLILLKSILHSLSNQSDPLKTVRHLFKALLWLPIAPRIICKHFYPEYEAVIWPLPTFSSLLLAH